jgi:hypothetical protein
MSVYLANALLPESPAIRIVQQTRDERQQAFWLDFDAGSANAARAQLGWLLTGTVIVASLLRLRRSTTQRSPRSRTPARFDVAKRFGRKHADYSFVDCTSFVVMRELGIHRS